MDEEGSKQYDINVRTTGEADGYIAAKMHLNTDSVAVIFIASEYSNISITTDNLRYIYHNKPGSSSDSDMFAYTILISYCNQDSNVETIFIHTTLDAGDILKCINALRGIQRRKYIGQEVDEDMKNQIDATLLAQPLFVGVVDLILFPAEDELSDPVMEPVKFLLVLDMESMCLFNNSSYLYPEHRLMFWTISDELSVEKVKLLTDTNRAKLIRLFRKDLCFQFPSITRLVEKLQKMTPTRQHLLKNPQELVGFLSERKRVSAQRPPTQTSQPWDDHDAQTSQPWVGHDADETQGPFSSDRKLALKLRNELDSAVEELKSNEEIEVFWVTMAADAQEMMDAGTIPTCDHRSGGMDPDNGDHLQRAIEDVAEQLNKNDVRVALSRLEACRELFKDSTLAEVKGIFSDCTNIELLKKIYYRSLCT